MARDVVFLLIALVLFALWGLPNLMLFFKLLFPRKVRCSFEEGDATIDAGEYPEETQQLHGDLTQMGFEPLGIKCEQRPLQSVKELAYASAAEKSFAAVHGFDSRAPHYYFYTPFRDGAVVLTCDLPMDPVRTDTFLHCGVPEKAPAQVFDQHRKYVEKMRRKGHEPYKDYTRKSRLEATHAYYTNAGAGKLQSHLLQKSLRNAGMSLGLVVLAVLFLLHRIL